MSTCCVVPVLISLIMVHVYVCLCIDVACICPCGVSVLEGAANGPFILLFKGSNSLAHNWYIGKLEGMGFTVCALLFLLMK